MSLILPGFMLLGGISDVHAVPDLHGVSPKTRIALLGDVSRKKKARGKIVRWKGKPLIVNAGCRVGCGGQITVDENAFRFLARHQDFEGSWKSRHPNCSCPKSELNIKKWIPLQKAETVESKKKVSKLVSQFQEESIEVREEAESELKKIGLNAIPGLLRGMKSEDGETSARCRSLLREIPPSPERDYTALVLLAFLGSGNKNGKVEDGRNHLLRNQSKEGKLGKGLDHILSTIALTEYIRLRGKPWPPPHTPTGRAVSYLQKIAVTTPREVAWKGLALKSASQAGIPWPKSSLATLEAVPLPEKDPWSWVAKKIIGIVKGENVSLGPTSGIFRTRMDEIDPELLYLINVIIYRYHPRGKHFSDWKTRLIKELRKEEIKDRNKCHFGSWKGETHEERLQKTSFRIMTLQLYYRFANTLARKN